MDQFAGYAPTVQLLEDLDNRGEELCVCSVVLSEVYAGLRPDAVSRARLLLDRCLYLGTSEAAARIAGEWRSAYRRQGIQLQTPDVLVAATSVEHGATLVTANLGHYPMSEVAILPLTRPYKMSR
jgi:predicted nucleic acid-binding protein